jgi:hypothetical protein
MPEVERRPVQQQHQSWIDEVHMWCHDHAMRELSHIETMIVQLERLIRCHDINPSTTVTTPAYWRARIGTVLATPGLPRVLGRRASMLLTRLDGLPAASRNR